MTPNEEWRPVFGFEGRYEVSDQGRVRTVERMVRSGRHGVRTIPARIRRLVPRRDGYLQVTLDRKTCIVHRLIARAFLGVPPEGLEVCHNNGDPLDNRLANLRYDTVSANRRDTVAHGRHRWAKRTHCGHGHPFDAANTAYKTDGSRLCKTCNRDRANRHYALKRLKQALEKESP